MATVNKQTCWNKYGIPQTLYIIKKNYDLKWIVCYNEHTPLYHNWARAWHFQQCGMCDQQSLSLIRSFASRLSILWLLATDWTPFEVSKLKRRLQRLVHVYTCQKVKLLEISCHSSNFVIHSVFTQIFRQICQSKQCKPKLDYSWERSGLGLHCLFVFLYRRQICQSKQCKPRPDYSWEQSGLGLHRLFVFLYRRQICQSKQCKPSPDHSWEQSGLGLHRLFLFLYHRQICQSKQWKRRPDYSWERSGLGLHCLLVFLYLRQICQSQQCKPDQIAPRSTLLPFQHHLLPI